MKRIFSMLISLTLSLSVLNFAQAHARGKNTTSASAAAQASLRFSPRFIRAANKKLRYTLKAKYPQAIGAKDARVIKLNQAIKDLITKAANDFQKDFAAPEERLGDGSTFEADYTVLHSANDIVSIAFFINTFYEGAAHGMDETVVLNYDLNSGKTLKLAELFKPKSNYLNLISDYSIKAIKKEMGENGDSDWIQKGAEATEENYKNWNITSKGLSISFERYQVAPYVYPPPEIVIPYSVLKNVIDPTGPLARVAGSK